MPQQETVRASQPDILTCRDATCPCPSTQFHGWSCHTSTCPCDSGKDVCSTQMPNLSAHPMSHVATYLSPFVPAHKRRRYRAAVHFPSLHALASVKGRSPRNQCGLFFRSAVSLSSIPLLSHVSMAHALSFECNCQRTRRRESLFIGLL